MRGDYVVRIWGSGVGPLRSLTPSTRLVTGAMLFIASVWSRPDEFLDFIGVAGVVFVWIVVSGIPLRTIWVLFLYGILTFGPFFLLVPLIDPGVAYSASTGSGLTFESFRVPWRIAAKGMASVILAAATASTLTRSDFYEALAGLPLPRIVVTLITQIAHQAGILLDETSRIANAIAVRGGTSRWRTSLILIKSIPSVWLPRIMFKAERVAAAMEIRQFGTETPRFEQSRVGTADLMVIVIVSIIALVLAVG